MTDGIVQCDISAGNRSSARAAISLDHVAVNMHAALAELLQVYDGAQRAAYEALNLLGATGLLALGRFTIHAATSGTRQHAIFRRDPALILAAQVCRHFFIHTNKT